MCVSQSTANQPGTIAAVAVSAVLLLDSAGAFAASSLDAGYAPVGLAVYAGYLLVGGVARWRRSLATSAGIAALMALVHSTLGWWLASRFGPESVRMAHDAATLGSRVGNAFVSSLIGAVLGLVGGLLVAAVLRLTARAEAS